ncbi:MAG: hypothetical protein IBX69_17850 [Anaerolineales bacterium]|nr:hypothetical protein [Anaerolineales bacterium]
MQPRAQSYLVKTQRVPFPAITDLITFGGTPALFIYNQGLRVCHACQLTIDNQSKGVQI